MRAPFILADSPSDAGKLGTHVALVPAGLKGKDRLLTSLARTLDFPNYAGGNWDSFEECIRDLSWIPENSVLLFHEGLPDLPKADAETYLDILAEAVLDWRRDELNELVVAFHYSVAG